MRFRTQYTAREEEKKGITFDLPSRTKQSFRDECDINNIMAKYAAGMPVESSASVPPVYGDVSNMPDNYQESLQQVMDAQEQFEALPSHIRKRFDYNPANMLQFIQDPNNYEEGVKLGLFEPRIDETVVVNRETINPVNSDSLAN